MQSNLTTTSAITNIFVVVFIIPTIVIIIWTLCPRVISMQCQSSHQLIITNNGEIEEIRKGDSNIYNIPDLVYITDGNCKAAWIIWTTGILKATRANEWITIINVWVYTWRA